jgi:hypothetical protein
MACVDQQVHLCSAHRNERGKLGVKRRNLVYRNRTKWSAWWLFAIILHVIIQCKVRLITTTNKTNLIVLLWRKESEAIDQSEFVRFLSIAHLSYLSICWLERACRRIILLQSCKLLPPPIFGLDSCRWWACHCSISTHFAVLFRDETDRFRPVDKKWHR